MIVQYKPEKRFECPCCGVNETDPRVAALVEIMESRLGKKLTVTSGYRCPKHNKAVKGSRGSSHMKGLAVDIACDNSRLRYQIVEQAILLRINRMELGPTWVHLDIDRAKDPNVIWFP